MNYLDIEKWNRKEHFNFYKEFEEPFFGVCVNVDITKALERAKALDVSFFLYYMHKSIVAANEVEPFKYRIVENGKILICENVDAGSTIGREDGTFGFSYLKYSSDLEAFIKTAQEEIDFVRSAKGLMSPSSTPDVIHYTTLPWFSFTSFSHARMFKFKDSIPKIAFAKYFKEGDKMKMPVSIHVHHGLMDGYHVGLYLERFQELLDDL